MRAAKAVDYVGAGTIEFIADASDGLSAERIFFMEMNTRLQVEHPVTEEITGVDLVEWQLRVASGEELPLKQEELSINGRAIEARLYAEDPAKGFPAEYRPVGANRSGGGGHRRRPPPYRDPASRSGDTVQPFYDPMIAKVIVWDEDRTSAIESLADVISVQPVWPVKTNAPIPIQSAAPPSFKVGDLTTAFLEDHADALEIAKEPTVGGLAHVAREVDAELGQDAFIPAFAGVWRGAGRFPPERRPESRNWTEPRCRFLCGRSRKRAGGVCVMSASYQDGYLLIEQGQTFGITTFRYEGAPSGAAADGAILAPMPGKVIAVDVAEGEAVTRASASWCSRQ